MNLEVLVKIDGVVFSKDMIESCEQHIEYVEVGENYVPTGRKSIIILRKDFVGYTYRGTQAEDILNAFYGHLSTKEDEKCINDLKAKLAARNDELVAAKIENEHLKSDIRHLTDEYLILAALALETSTRLDKILEIATP